MRIDTVRVGIAGLFARLDAGGRASRERMAWRHP
jgi:hypothetical protein